MTTISNISYRADISGLRQQLEKVPGITKVQAQRMVKNLDSSLKKAEKATKRSYKTQGKAVDGFAQKLGGLKGLAAGVIGGAVVAAAHRAAQAFGALTDEINQTAKEAREVQTGVERFQRLADAMELMTRGGFKTSDTLNKLRKNLVDAAQGSTEYSDALDNIGLRTEDLIGLSADEQFLRVADAIGAAEDQSIAANAAIKLLGRGGGKALAAFADGRHGIEQTMASIEDTSIVSAEAAREAELLADAQQMLARTARSAGAVFLEHVGPAVREVVGDLQEMLAEAQRSGEMADAAQGIAGALREMSKELRDVLPSLLAAAGALDTIVRTARAIRGVMGFIPEFGIDVVKGMFGLGDAFENTVENIDRVRGALGDGRDAVESIADDVERGTARIAAADMGGAGDPDPLGRGSGRTGGGGGTTGGGVPRDEPLEQMEQWRDAILEVQEIREAANRDQLSEIDKITTKYQEQLDQLDLLAEKSGGLADVESARADVVARMNREVLAEQGRILDEAHAKTEEAAADMNEAVFAQLAAYLEGNAEAQEDALARINEFSVEGQEIVLAAIKETEEEAAASSARLQRDYVDAATMVGGAFQDAGSIIGESLRLAGAEGSEAASALALTELAAGTAATTANMIVAAAKWAAGSKSWVEGLAVIGAAVAAMAGMLGTIAKARSAFQGAQKHAGGPIGDDPAGMAASNVPITAQGGEVMWSRQDVSRQGGIAAVEELRRGGGPSVLQVQYQVNNRTTGAMEYEMLRSGGGPYARMIAKKRPQRRGLHRPGRH